VPTAYGFTEDFEKEVLRKRPYLTRELCIRVLQQSIRDESQEGNRHRFWAAVPEHGEQIPARGDLDGSSNHPQRMFGQAVQAMKVNYYPETDSLYIDLSEQPSVEGREISEGVVLDYDESGNLVGIDIDNASRKVELQRFVVSRIPARVETAG
jgi:uncharacterized protein YuzE